MNNTIHHEWIYLSHEWGPSCPSYGGGEKAKFSKKKCLKDGDSCNTIELSGSNHIGTHFDFPNHFDPNGRTATDYDANFFIFNKVGLIWFKELRNPSILEADFVSEYLTDVAVDIEILLFRTGATNYRQQEKYWSESIGVGEGVADLIRTKFKKLRAVGLDTISISSLSNRELGRKVHREFLCDQRPILIIEDMNLEPLNGKAPDQIIGLPLRIENGDGAPCTVIAKSGM